MKLKILTFVMSFMFMFMFVTPSMAAVSVESLPDGIVEYVPSYSSYPYEQYFVYERLQGGIYVTYVKSEQPFVLDSYVTHTDGDYSVFNYELKSKEGIVYRGSLEYVDGSWEYTGVASNFNLSSSISFQATKLYDSNIDIRASKDSNEIFFPDPPEELYQIIQKVTTEETTKLSQTTVGTMKILTVCGVGLIALLVALNLFGKVLRNFQVK